MLYQNWRLKTKHPRTWNMSGVQRKWARHLHAYFLWIVAYIQVIYTWRAEFWLLTTPKWLFLFMPVAYVRIKHAKRMRRRNDKEQLRTSLPPISKRMNWTLSKKHTKHTISCSCWQLALLADEDFTPNCLSQPFHAQKMTWLAMRHSG